MKRIVKIIIILIIMALTYNCSTVSKRLILERNEIKDRASDNTKKGNTFLKRYEYQKALQFFNKALSDNIKVDNISGMIKNYTDIGRVNLFLKNYDLALTYFNTALNLANEEYPKYKMEKAYTILAMGEAYYFKGDYEKASDYYNQALKLEISLKDEENQAIITLNLGKIERKKGNYQQSITIFKRAAGMLESLLRREEIENINNLSLIYYTLGQSYSKLSDIKQAESYIEKALKIDKMIENSSGIADDYFALGMLAKKKQDLVNALKYFNRSRNIYKILDNAEQFAELSYQIADVYLKLGKLDQYYKIERLLFLITRDNKRQKIAQNIIDMLTMENIEKYFTEEEIKEIEKTYKKYVE